jgi:hypothetical protein
LNFSDEAEAKINSLVCGQSILPGILAAIFEKPVQMVSRFGPDLVQIWSRFCGPNHLDQFWQPPSWCLSFEMTDGYLRFIPTNGQMTVPFFLVVIFYGCNLIDKETRQKT